MAAIAETAPAPPRRHPVELVGGWEVGLFGFMVLLYLVGYYVNPGFFGTTDALGSILRDSARYGVMAVGMTFVIVNKDLDLSVGSTYGLAATIFSIAFAPPGYYDANIFVALAAAIFVGLLIGLINGVLVTYLMVPAFIATLTMLFIGRGLVLGFSGGKNISYIQKAKENGWFFQLGETNVLGFNNQVIILAIFAIVGMLLLAKTRIGYETYATGGNELAASYSGIPTRWVRIRAYLFSALCATVAALMSVAQSKGISSQDGFGSELIVIAAVIVGGASILGGRGRVLGAVLGAILVVLIDKVLREGVPTTRIVTIGDTEMEVRAMAQLPPGAVPAFIGLILLIAVLIEPWVIRRKLIPRLMARLMGKPPPPLVEIGGVAIVGAQTKGPVVAATSYGAGRLARILTRRDTAAVLVAAILWGIGFYLRPDFWANIDNTFTLMLAFTEVGLLSVGLTFVIANGDIDLSVGAVLALAGATAAFFMKQLGFDPLHAVLMALLAGCMAGVVNAFLTVNLRLPAFVATLGMFYMARGIGAWLVAGRQLSGFPEDFNLIGRKLIEALRYFDIAPERGTLVYAIADALSVQTIFMVVVAVLAGIFLGATHWGQQIYATGGNLRAAQYAGINTDRVRFLSLVFAALCATCAGIIWIAFFRSFAPQAGQLRELDAIAAVIIGGGSIFGGHGTVLGSLAGAAVIALMRALLSLQIITSSGQSIVMPQHWVNVFIGLILIAAVLGDIWVRRLNVRGAVLRLFPGRRSANA